MQQGYTVAFGIKRGKCTKDACSRLCGYYTSNEEGGVCINCAHFPGTHENLGPLTDEVITSEPQKPKIIDFSKLEPIYYDDPDPYNLLKEEDLEIKENESEKEAKEKLDDLCEWKVKNNEIKILKKLGSGKSAKVYKGLYRDQDVAVKVLKPVIDTKELSNFKGELDIMSSVNSPYVVKFYGGCLQPRICMLMEYCSRGSLYHVMNDETVKMDWNLAIKFIQHSVLGVAALHSLNPPVVHRDLKSLNLLVNQNMDVKVCDFGLSRFNPESLDDSTLQKVRGTYAYTAPEIYFGKKYTHKSDVFSLSIVIWEIMMRLYKGEYVRPYAEYPNLRIDFQIIIFSAKKNKRPTIPENCPDFIQDLITECWSKEPDDRPSCSELVQKLEGLQQEYESNKAQWDSFSFDQSKIGSSSNANDSVTNNNNNNNNNNNENNNNLSSPPEKKVENDNNSNPSSTPPADKKRSFKRSASKKILNAISLKDKKTSETIDQENKIQWTHKDASTISNDDKNPGITGDVVWTHTGTSNQNWLDEDDFDDDKPKKKKKKGFFSKLKKKR
eukprot:TRINITY_DN749_c4_g1_i1.p1 TRINITY_DN749_c4_g1~~TRINITY_DN749_c4_g1_i1.p1  ORF type:complete len:554 (-),score=165.32 TRINITY_DN749_c4_g1_i1:219-1880(-)